MMRRISQLSLAVDWLTERLADGPVPSRIIRDEGAELGLNYTVLLRAAKELDLISRSVPGQFGCHTTWEAEK